MPANAGSSKRVSLVPSIVVSSLVGAVFRHGLISPAECEALIESPRPWATAKVTDADGRGTTAGDKRADCKLVPLEPASEWIYARLAEFLARDVTYGFALRELDSPIKIQRYAVGGYHGWHVDLAGGRERKLGISVQLSAPADYDGGELRLYDPPDHANLPRARGCAIAFPSYVPHEVTPVTRGVRYALTAWALGPPFR